MSSWSVSRARHVPWLAPIVMSLGCGAEFGGPSLGAMRAEYARTAPSAEARKVDELAIAAPALDRCAFVAAVLGRNPSMDAARQAWRAALARARRTGAIEDPRVAVEIAPLSIGSSTAPLGIDVSFSQRLPWPGKGFLAGQPEKKLAFFGAGDTRPSAHPPICGHGHANTITHN